MKRRIILLVLAIISILSIRNVYAETCDTNNVIIKNIIQKGKTEGAAEKNDATIDNNKINLDIKMTDVDDYIEYGFNVENKSNETVEFNEKSIVSDDNHFNYEFTYEDNSNIIPAHTDKDITLTITYARAIEESNFENGVYQVEETNTLSVTDSKIENPITISFFSSLIIIFMEIFIITGLLIIKNKYMKALLLLLCFIPSTVYAICNYEMEICTNIEVTSLPSINNVNIGEYISLTPDSSSYTIVPELTGKSQNQTITPNELTLWRVISKNGDGTIDAVSEYVSSNTVSLDGTTGYAKFVGTLQTIANQYAKQGYTSNTRIMGYDGQTLEITDTSNFDGTNPPSGATPTESPTTGIGEEFEGGVFGDTLYLKDYQLVSNVYKTDTSTYGSNGLIAYKVGTSTKGYYWLASRNYASFTSSNILSCFYNGRAIYSDGSFYSGYMRTSYAESWSDGQYQGFYLRPIITIKSSVSISSGNGDKNTPYTLIE